MSRAVLSDDAAASIAKTTGRFEADIMNDLVVGALQEGGIDRHNGRPLPRGRPQT